MIITQKKPLEEVLALLGDVKKVAIVGCANCAAACQTLKDACADVIELRIDSLAAMPQTDAALEAIAAVRANAQGLPVLWTLRTERDGGAGSADAEAYEALLIGVIESGTCEAVDVELSVGENAFSRIVRAAHERGVSVVGSSHEFGAIGSAKTAGEWLRRQAALGADICKAAVMPHSREEAFLLMAEMAKAGGEIAAPHVAIVMGEMGAASRVCAASLGSCMTFGAAGKASAPGQIEAGKLRKMLAALGAGGGQNA